LGWSIANNLLSIDDRGDYESTTQTVTLTAGVTYTVLVSTTHRAGSVTLTIDDGVELLSEVLDTTDSYSFSITPGNGGSTTVTFTADTGVDDADMDVSLCSVIQTGYDIKTLNAGGTDFPLQCLDAHELNDIAVKNSGYRPDKLLYSRTYPLGKIYFDAPCVAGEILVMDVQVNRMAITQSSDTLQFHPQAQLWLRYALADMLAGEYGKELTQSQRMTLDRAWDALSSSNRKANMLRPMHVGRQGGRYNIDGDR
jgi:hypothetical protein